MQNPAEPTSPPTTAQPKTPSGWQWPALIFAILGLYVVVNFVMFQVASQQTQDTVETDYYKKAVAWDQTMEQQRENLRLGWQVRMQPALTVAQGRDAVVVKAAITDAGGNALDGAVVEVEAFANALSSARTTVRLTPAEKGIYTATLPLTIRGLWEFRFAVTRGTDRFTSVVRHDVH